jgi:hypothetical protein
MTDSQAAAALDGLRVAEDVRRLRGRIEQMTNLGAGSTIHLRDGRSFPVPVDATRRRQLAGMVVLIEMGNFLGAYGLGPKERGLLSQLAMAFADLARGVANPLLEVAPRVEEDGSTVARRRAPGRIEDDLAIGAAAAAIYRRAQAGQRHGDAADEVAAVLNRISLVTPSEKRRGKDDAGVVDPQRRRWTGPRPLALFYAVQKSRGTAEKGVVKNAAGRRARFFSIALRETHDIPNFDRAAAEIENSIIERLTKLYEAPC